MATSSNATDFCGEPVTKIFPPSSCHIQVLASRRYRRRYSFIFSLSLCRADEESGPGPRPLSGSRIGATASGVESVSPCKNHNFSLSGIPYSSATICAKVALTP